MSYINDALKKVQKEKDSLYRHYGNIISDPVYRRTRHGKKWMITAGVIVLILLALPIFILLRYNAFSGTGNSSMDVIQEKEKDEHRTSNIERPTPAVLAPGRGRSNVQHSPCSRPVAAGRILNEKEKLEDVKNLYSKALNYQQNGNPAMAEKVYRKILVRDPGFVMGLNNLGVICMDRKRNKEAADMFSKAIDLKADYVDPYYNLACLYSMSGNISKSLYYLKMAVSINNSVKNWAKNDKDLEGLRRSETYKKIME
ncbi:MAG: hypothetical protein SRB1_02545 [Desulfobacteraceae bacterium Eth-SRB1]|nr:MAG: hypothetical protein SRB1_02545 [Desulfobacteraceae bacterium Eth-SRB1]